MRPGSLSNKKEDFLKVTWVWTNTLVYTNPRVNCVQIYTYWKVEKYLSSKWKALKNSFYSILEKLGVPIKKFEAYQPIFYLKKSNKMEKSFTLSIVEHSRRENFVVKIKCKSHKKNIVYGYAQWLKKRT